MKTPPFTDHPDIVTGLLQTPARIAPKYFYDARGSDLFEQITRLGAYYPTRTENAILAAQAQDIAQRVGRDRTVIELGAGNCEKATTLCQMIQPARFVAVDISADFLHAAIGRMRAMLPHLDIQAVAGDLGAELSLPPQLPAQRRLVFYPGSSIGNFDPPQALALLARMRGLLQADGALLIGVDLLKDSAVLDAAYNDTQGVTAAFNLNVLSHVNRLIGSDFDVGQWRHCAFFNAPQSRIEMHLEARADTAVQWPGGRRAFARGERIHTENSYKYQLPDFLALLRQAGFGHTHSWTDARGWFALVLAHA